MKKTILATLIGALMTFSAEAAVTAPYMLPGEDQGAGY